MSSIDHIFLYLVLFGVFVVWGIYASKIRNNYYFWIISAFPIALYSFVVGSRFGWGPDYISYKGRYENAFSYNEEQIGFRYLNQWMLGFDLLFPVAFFVYSAIFMVGVIVLVRSYKYESKYMFAFIVPATLLMVTNVIRQGVALSFIYIAIYFVDRKKWYFAVGSLLIGGSIHSSVYVTAVIIVLIKTLIARPITWKISIPVYTFFAFFYDIRRTSTIANYFQYIQLNNKFQAYVENSDVWFGQDAVNSIYQQGIFQLIISSLFYCAFMYIGFESLKFRENSRIIYIYNSVVVGVILYRAVFMFEILRRFAEPLLTLYFIVIGYAIYTLGDSQKGDIQIYPKPQKWKYQLAVFVIAIYLVFFWGRFLVFNPEAYFVWNSNM